MKYFELEGKKYPFSLNISVYKKLMAKQKIDVVAEDDMSWIDDPETLSLVGYESLKEGCKADEINTPYTEKRYLGEMTIQHSLEVSGMLMDALLSATNYATTQFKRGNDEKK
jgi:hypothetical protein